MNRGDQIIEQSLRAAASAGRPALVAYLTGGYPDHERFVEHLRRLCDVADAVEIGVPFSDPLADGVTIQRASRVALQRGTSLAWILDALERERDRLRAPRLLMSYVNPLYAFGFERLAQRAAQAGVSGFIVPDLPFEEGAEFGRVLDHAGLAQVQLVSPVTPPERLARLCAASQGFVYAVTVAGVTGAALADRDALRGYLARVRAAAHRPVLAGFGIRSRNDVATLAGECDGVIVGTALIESIDRGDDPALFLEQLRGAPSGREESSGSMR